MDRLHAMEIFVRVVESGSFTAAARAMGVGQPAISKMIAALEDQLGTALLLRSARQMTPTEAGLHFYERARQLIDDSEDVWSSIRGEATELSGRLRICAPVTFGRLNIMPQIGKFLTAHPRINLEMVLDDRAIDLLAENIDIALRMGVLADSALTARRLATGERMVVATPAYLERRGTPLVPADLVYHEAVLYARPGTADEWRFRKGTAETSVSVPSRLTVTAAEGMREAVLGHCGVALTSSWMMARELADGRVVRLLPDWSLPTIDLWSVLPAGRRLTARARAFLQWLEPRLRDGGSTRETFMRPAQPNRTAQPNREPC